MHSTARLYPPFAAFVALVLASPPAQAFCGFFVGGADATLYNNASQVVMVHDEGKTILTMVNNYRGEPRSFALVVPVPVVLEKEMVRVIEPGPIEHLDQFSAPRLVEYFDPDPCYRPRPMHRAHAPMAGAAAPQMESALAQRAAALGVKIEAAFSAGEYDIEILSATESDGLETYLIERKYNIPKGAAAALAPYIRTKMKFFVAKVNLEEKAKSEAVSLRPLQFAFPDERFMLPIRLGMLNADGPQELIVFAITRQFRVEVTNYRNPMLPTGMNIPVFVKDDFKHFYRDMFSHQVDKEHGTAVFTEHAWSMGWCDPCASQPLAPTELQKLGVWWNDTGSTFVTRIHARYTPETFPEDLMLKVTKDASNFQARYVLQHAFAGQTQCAQADAYWSSVQKRQAQEQVTLASLTGWSEEDISNRMPKVPKRAGVPSESDPAWRNRVRDLFRGKDR